ncbi:MAG: ABC transporter ATP-binding protein [Candidatus Omnitrophica bacterium]|nr:ABC transporter ATP-binding protein [Candidatus Omnitrophota bacterium]
MMLRVIELKKYFRARGPLFRSGREPVRAVDGVSFSIEKGRTFGLVGESGSGKSTVAKLIVNILRPDSGRIIVNGDCDIVFQDPFSSLNPRMRIRDIVGESLRIRGISRRETEKRVKETLALVRLERTGCIDKYPHQFSGGERQRIAIARAIIRHPGMIVLDEPVSSLDVSIQAGILNLLKDLQQGLGLTYVFISHDLRVVEFMADTVGVMKDGKLVEIASSREIYTAPRAEYTRHLLNSIPRIRPE